MVIKSPGQADKEKNDILSLDCLSLWLSIASLTMVAQTVKNLPAMREAWVRSLLGRSPGEGNGNPLQYLFWRIPWAEEPGRVQSMGSQSRTPLTD